MTHREPGQPIACVRIFYGIPWPMRRHALLDLVQEERRNSHPRHRFPYHLQALKDNVPSDRAAAEQGLHPVGG